VQTAKFKAIAQSEKPAFKDRLKFLAMALHFDFYALH